MTMKKMTLIVLQLFRALNKYSLYGGSLQVCTNTQT